MDKKKEAFMKRLLATFRVEADEHIKALSSGLIQLEKSIPGDTQTLLIETMYREAHTFKGAARSVDLSGIETICQQMEGVLRKFKHTGVIHDPGIFDVLHKALDIIEQLNSGGVRDLPEIPGIVGQLEQIEKGTFTAASITSTRVSIPGSEVAKKEDKPAESRRQIIAAIEARRQQQKQPVPPGPHEKIAAASTIRLSTEKLETVLLQSEEMIYGKLALNRFIDQLNDIRETLDTWNKKSAETTPGDIKNLRVKIKEFSKSLQNDSRVMGSLIDTHLDDTKNLLMLPFSTLTEGFPKTVRDLARDKGKEIDIIIQGTENEIDKRVLEAIKSPLLHILRNAVDHGIESPTKRTRLGKPTTGTLRMTISRVESTKAEILFSDDGAGIDLEKLKENCIQSGILSEEDVRKQTDLELLEMIFHSEFSTSPLITDISGRGLGLAIAREKVEKLGGTITVQTELQKGTTFRILLPLTLATFRGVLVKAGNSSFIIPTLNVERVLRVRPKEIKTVENRETVIIHRRVISHVPLDAVLGIQRDRQILYKPEFLQLLVLNAEGTHIAFSVDRVHAEEEVLVKNLGRQLRRVINISGAAVLSTGEIVLILNVSDLIKSAVRVSTGPTTGREKGKKNAGKSVLIIEDSITSRILLKNILESSGYRVTTAVDGTAGWALLQETPYDLVISDVDMPRMNGFELTAKIRADKKLSSLPVILVTCMETREDREKGIEVGANAYIVKSSFDQGNLLAVLKRIL
jgi:two-component system chemotaxis sensor kinase CheA